MNVKMSIQLCIFLLLLFINQVFLTVLEEEELFRENIDVHPGGDERSFLGRGGGLKCEFTYQCQGGTNEEWVMVIKREQDGHYTCLVERPENHPPSYLFFTDVRLKVNGGSIKSALIHGSDRHKEVNENEYKIHKHHVEFTDNFQHGLNSIYTVIHRKKHAEL